MMHTLLESGGGHVGRRASWTVASVVMHLSLIAAAVAVTAQDNLASIAVPDPPTHVIFTVPQPRPIARERMAVEPSPAGRSYVNIPLVALPSVPTFDPALPFSPADAWPERVPGIAERSDAGPVPLNGVYTDALVDRIVAPRSNNPRPEYPAALRLSNLEGDVLVRFVVDTTGRVEATSITIVQATHALFGAAVRNWLPRTAYAPAQVRGQPVRQLVEQRVGFSLRP